MWFKRFTDKLREMVENAMADQISRALILTTAVAVLVGLLSFWFYNRSHVFDDARILTSASKDDIEGTHYVMLGSHVIKYSPDGVFCVDASNNTSWSSAYSMQTPVSDVNGKYMVIIEQQGTQVYVVSETGMVGQFETELPILNARISENGVIALVLRDDPATWINMYTKDGSQIASVKTTVQDSGYPLSLALSSDAKKLMVSFSKLVDGELTGAVTFYDFGSSATTDDSHIAGTAEYPRELFPVVFYGSDDTPIAVGDEDYIVFKRGTSAQERTKVNLGREIVSTFWDGENTGFIFRSESETEKYNMEVYSHSGHKTMTASFGFEYTGVRMENGEILLYDAQKLYIYRTSGKQKLSMDYSKPVRYFTSIPGFRKYLVITSDSMDQIRLR